MVSETEFLASYPQTAPKGAPNGHPGHLTPQQEKALHHLHDLLQAEGYTQRLDEATLLRFLRARKFDVAKARAMFVACEQWRKSYGTDTILTDFRYTEKPQVMKFYPQFYHKTDKSGRPVYYEILGKVDINAMYKITTQERMLQNLVWEYESFVRYRLPATSRQHGHLIETSFTVFDLKGVSVSKASQVFGYIQKASHLSQNYYPERMGKFFVINAPFGFSTVWSVIKRFLDPVTVDKISILGSKYKSELLKHIDAANLPERFGGSSKTQADIWMTDEGPWRNPKYIGPEGEAPSSDLDGEESVGSQSTARTAESQQTERTQQTSATTASTVGTGATVGAAAGSAGSGDSSADAAPHPLTSKDKDVAATTAMPIKEAKSEYFDAAQKLPA